jgi:hypothetical protein
MTPGSGRGTPVALDVAPYDIHRYQQQDLPDVVIRATEFFATFGQPLRVLTRAEPYRLAAAVAGVEARILGAPPALRDPLVAHRRHLERLDAGSELQRLRYTLLVWTEGQLEPAALAQAASESFGTPVSVARAFPQAFQGAYEVAADHLAPAAANRGQPYLQLLVAYHVQGEWSPYTIHPLLNLGYPFALAQDIYTFPPARALLALTNAAGALSAQLQAPGGAGPDTRAERSAADCEHAMHAVELGQRLHKIAHVLLIKAPTLAELRRLSQTAQTLLGPRLPFRVERGRQAELLGYFGPRPAAQLAAAAPQRTILSRGLAVMTPFGKRTRTSADGILLGLEAGGYPIFHQGWHAPGQQDKRAHHRIICGETGYGKTVAVQTWALQEALLNDAQVVLLEPQGHGRRLIAAVGEEGRYHAISFAHTRLNILDVVEETLPDQITHVEQLLHALLNSTAAARGGAGAPARALTTLERGALHQALREVYGDCWQTLTPATTPRLRGLCARLRQIEHGALLGAEIAALFVEGTYAAVFDRPTNLDLSLEARVVAFDVRDVQESFRTLLYGVTLAAVRRRTRRKPADQKLLFVIDEFAYLAQEPSLAGVVAHVVKTARTFRTAIWMVEQNPFTFDLNTAGRYILENVQSQVYFRQAGTAPELVRRFNPMMTDRHLGIMRVADVGEAIVRLENDVYHIRVQPNAYEQRYFLGS